MWKMHDCISCGRYNTLFKDKNNIDVEVLNINGMYTMPL